MLRIGPTLRRSRKAEAGDARWWLLGVLALSLLGWLWFRPSAPLRSTEELLAPPSPASPTSADHPSQVETAKKPTRLTTPSAEFTPRQPMDLTPGAVTPLGPVVVRSNLVTSSSGVSSNLPVQSALSNSAQTSTSFQETLEAQLTLARLGFSSGSLDGKLGAQTRAAIRAFQEREQLNPSGTLDAATREKLTLSVELFSSYVVTEEDLQRLHPLGKTWLEKSEQNRMEYETILELVSEKAQSHPALVRTLNPGVDWDHVSVGTPVVIPNPERPPLSGRAAFLRITLAAKTLQAFDADSKIMLHCPCSIAKDKEKRPVGDLHVEKIAPNPNYTFNPDVFPESEEARQLKRKLILQPGPNNPVGVAWISLDRPGYGIHGTPGPEQVGRTESHGCFRLANWNAELLVKLVWVGMPVQVEP